LCKIRRVICIKGIYIYKDIYKNITIIIFEIFFFLTLLICMDQITCWKWISFALCKNCKNHAKKWLNNNLIIMLCNYHYMISSFHFLLGLNVPYWFWKNCMNIVVTWIWIQTLPYCKLSNATNFNSNISRHIWYSWEPLSLVWILETYWTNHCILVLK